MSGNDDLLPVRPAGFLLRAVAFMIDIGLLWLVAWLVTIPLDVPFISATPADLAAGNVLLTLFAVMVFAAWLYFAGMESSGLQATLGKASMGIYVTDLRGMRASFPRTTIRHWARIVSTLIVFIGYLMAMFTPRRQALHDMLAGCLVLKR
jgi:uncharacterized RDD family membrane protein YckC